MKDDNSRLKNLTQSNQISIIPELVREERPDRILDIAEEIMASDSEWNRICPRPGFGKSQGALLTLTGFDKFLSFQYETVWDKYQDYLEQQEDNIKGEPEAAIIVAWNKALGIKSHDGTVGSIEELDRDKIPKKFRAFYNDPEFDKIRKKTVEDGGKAARDAYYDTMFYQTWADQFRKKTSYQDKAVFTTVSMASKFDRLYGAGKVFVDEGISGRVDGDVHTDWDENPCLSIVTGFCEWNNIGGNDYSLSIQGMSQTVRFGSKQKAKVTKSMKDCRDLTSELMREIEDNDNEMVVEKEGKQANHTIGVLEFHDGKALQAQQRIKDLKLPNNYDKEDDHHTYWQAERRENPKDRKKLIALEEAIEWFNRACEEKVVYLKQDGEVVKVMAPKHYKDIVSLMGNQKFLMKATYTPSWDDKMGQDTNYIMEQESIRNADLSDYEGDFHHIKYREDKEAINSNGLYTQKMKYLYKLLDTLKEDSLKVVPKKIHSYFDSKVETKETAIGKNFSDTEDVYSIALQRLDDYQYAWEFAKEFQKLPESNPSDIDNKVIEDHTFKAFKDEDNQLMFADRVEAPTVDSLFRTFREIDDEGNAYYLGAKTRGMEEDWFDNLDIKKTLNTRGLINVVAKENPKKAIELAEDTDNFSPGDYNWAKREYTKESEGVSFRVDAYWAAEHLAWKYDTITTAFVAEYSGRQKQICRKAIKTSDNIKKKSYGEYEWKD